MSFLEKLKARRSVRHFDAEYTISEDEIHEMVADASLAPSTNNLQSWKIFAVSNKEIQAKMQALSYGQKQVADASVVFLVFADTDRYLNPGDLHQLMVERGVHTKEEAEQKTEAMAARAEATHETDLLVSASVDASLFAMNLMHVIRAYGYESVPMTGTDFAALKKLLGIDEALRPIMILPVGKAVGKGHPPVRFKTDAFLTIIK